MIVTPVANSGQVHGEIHQRSPLATAVETAAVIVMLSQAVAISLSNAGENTSLSLFIG